MTDPTEGIRRKMVGHLNAEAAELAKTTDDPRAALEAKYGQCWDTKELQETFEVRGFMAPMIGVTRKSDGAQGTLLFSHSPRFYHSWNEA